MSDAKSVYSAAEVGLGFIYQPRLALLKLLDMPESASVLIEKSDDLEFNIEGGRKSLSSLKHKAEGNRLTDLDIDFWKSVNIWCIYYINHGKIASDADFILFTTAILGQNSALNLFAKAGSAAEERHGVASALLENSNSQIVKKIRAELAALSEDELRDFYGRITILDGSPRINAIPQLIIDRHLRTVRREYRISAFERLEGWWMDLMIKVLAGERAAPVSGREVSDRLSIITEKYRSDNLPINFRNRMPDGNIDTENDSRLFVGQLRDLDISAARIQSAIVDYYRAYEQRSSWARENLLISGEMEEYEDRLVEEWSRYREIVFEEVHAEGGEEAFKAAGRELYRWAEMETSGLRIRERVTEPYVVRGAFQILANNRPSPRVFWNPSFMKRLADLLGVAA